MNERLQHLLASHHGDWHGCFFNCDFYHKSGDPGKCDGECPSMLEAIAMFGCVVITKAEYEALKAENARLAQKLNETDIITCEWCDFKMKYAGDPKATLEQMRAHVLVCPNHPMREVEAENARLKKIEDAARAYLLSESVYSQEQKVLAMLLAPYDETPDSVREDEE